ncbi:MAG: hypothetical protein SFV17_05005 [Candidatus Obscuribacter sp.]|nr:hypothetical protein [Candidatus Melainabacteria bacterium]MDX1986024.1 hypothetical protein [Candidatus Obscuribacter sp.]
MKVGKISLTGLALLTLLAVSQLPSLAAPMANGASQAQQDVESLDRVGFMPGGWDRNDLRTDVENYSSAKDQAATEESLDRTQFMPGGWDLNDLRTDVDNSSSAQEPSVADRSQTVPEESLERTQFMPGGWDHNDLRTDAP